MAKARTRRSPSSPSSGRGRSAPGSSTPSQDALGNAALQEELTAGSREKQGDWSLFGIDLDWLNPSTWFGDEEKDAPAPTADEILDVEEEEVPTPAVVEDSEIDVADTVEETTDVKETVEVVEQVDEAMQYAEDGPTDMASRPERVRANLKGALIDPTGATEIEIRSAAGEDASVTTKIADGTPCRIVRSENGWIEVAFRDGTKESTGWVPVTVFSDQPSLFMDKKSPELQEGYTWTHVGDPQVTQELEGSDVEQGSLADCYFIAAMNAVGSANPDFLEESIKYDASSGMYSVRFFEEGGWDPATRSRTYDEVWIEVDGYLPTKGTSTSGAYASAAAGKVQWGAIIEKAYAKWKGGYDKMGDGGYGDQAMTELTGQASSDVDSSRMTDEECLAFFQKAEEDGLAVYCGSLAAMEQDVQTPLTGTASGPYTGTVKQIHEWNNIDPGSLRIVDTEGNVGSARDTGSRGDESSAIRGTDVKEGEVEYEANKISVEYKEGKEPAKGSDLEVRSRFGGMLYPAKQVIGWHGYSFDKVVDGKLIQLYNPWGSYQPKPLTPAEFLKYYNGISTVQVPQAEGKK